MAVDVEIIGNGAFAGSRSSVGTYSVQEESTPVDASDSSGGIGQITFAAIDSPDRFGSVLLLNDEVNLTDGDRGLVKGKINSLTGNDGLLNVSADSLLGNFVGYRRAEWVNGTLEQVLTYYFGLAGITGGFGIDASLANLPVTAMGWVGDVWIKLKELLVVYGAEIAVVRGQILVRPVRGRRALEVNNSTVSWNAANADLTETIEVAYYNTAPVQGGLVYPVGGWTDDVDVYSVDAGESKTINIPVDAWITELSQPVAQDYVASNSTDNVYAVAGNDGFPITAAQWKATGGSLKVAIGEDGQSIDLMLVGATGASEKYAPYRIAVSAGSGDYYSSLRIHGTGVLFNRKTVTVPTGAGSAANSGSSATVDNIFIRTEGQARDAAAAVAGRYSSPSRTISVSKADINKPGSSNNSYDYITFAEYDSYLAANSISTFADFDAFYAGDTFSDLDEYWYSQVEDSFDFQVFGNAPGARVQWRRNMYRIRSVTITESRVEYTAEADTTFNDFDALTSGMTFAEFDALFADKTFSDFALAPLVNVKPEYDRE